MIDVYWLLRSIIIISEGKQETECETPELRRNIRSLSRISIRKPCFEEKKEKPLNSNDVALSEKEQIVLDQQTLTSFWQEYALSIRQDGLYAAVIRKYVPIYVSQELVKFVVAGVAEYNLIMKHYDDLRYFFTNRFIINHEKFDIDVEIDPAVKTNETRSDMTLEELNQDIRAKNKPLKEWLEEFGV
ncbi:MAG: hypothetical protein ACTTKZ_01405 [Bacteroides sp.]